MTVRISRILAGVFFGGGILFIAAHLFVAIIAGRP